MTHVAQKGQSAALRFLLRSTQARPQTEAELRAKLRSREYAEPVIAAALQQATALGAVDDAAFAKAWVTDRGLARGFSALRLREELRGRGVPEPLIETALATLETRDDLAMATELARERARRMPGTLTPQTVARRLMGFLGRRGYPEALARRVAIDVSGLGRQWD